ncbi:MAG: hypothetical protein IJE08_11395 [Clostridia bacterium]|nr:hypothetical protein [Clostridia bacterium]
MKKLFPAVLALLMLLMPLPVMAEGCLPRALTADEAAAANLFLSNFTETGIRSCSSYSDDMVLVDFAHDHMWFNSQSSYEYGEYSRGNNCRVSDDRIQTIIDKYFYDSYPVDLSETRFDYIDGYYYHCETGGWTSCGFAHAVSICPIGDNQYFVLFYIYGGGNHWENSILSASTEEIEALYGAPGGCGSALIYAEDLADRSTYKMISYSAA